MLGLVVILFCLVVPKLVISDQAALTCPLNEVINHCANAQCKVEDCIMKGRDMPCALVDHCEPGCNCKDGYLRGTDGICIPEDDCPPLTCPLNEVVNHCANAKCKVEDCIMKGRDVPCALVDHCEPGCNCQDGYLRGTDGICIPEDDCPPLTCPLNEVVNHCANAKCKVEDCIMKGRDVPCALVDHCEPECNCQDGYLRGTDGICIPEDDCPPLTCPLNEVVNHCANAKCKVEDCIMKGRDVPCALVDHCEPGCNCQDGYLRGTDGICIPEDDCPPLTCPLNEVVNHCANAKCKVEDCIMKGRDVPCALVDHCEPGCNCQDGYLRGTDGICIPEDDCPPIYQ